MKRLVTLTESDELPRSAAPRVRVAARQALGMIAYLAILGSGLSGYAGIGAWAVAIAAVILVSISQVRYGALYRRAAELGLDDMAQSTLLQSFTNAIMVTTAAYAAGWVFRLV